MCGKLGGALGRFSAASGSGVPHQGGATWAFAVAAGASANTTSRSSADRLSLRLTEQPPLSICAGFNSAEPPSTGLNSRLCHGPKRRTDSRQHRYGNEDEYGAQTSRCASSPRFPSPCCQRAGSVRRSTAHREYFPVPPARIRRGSELLPLRRTEYANLSMWAAPGLTVAAVEPRVLGERQRSRLQAGRARELVATASLQSGRSVVGWGISSLRSRASSHGAEDTGRVIETVGVPRFCSRLVASVSQVERQTTGGSTNRSADGSPASRRAQHLRRPGQP